MYSLYISHDTSPLDMYNLKQKKGQLVNDFIIEWTKVTNLVQIPTKKKHVLFRALLLSCRHDFLDFKDFP